MKKPQFIVVGYPRTGTTLLLSSLGNHPEITQAMEIFHHALDETTQPHAVWRKNKFLELYDERQENMVGFRNSFKDHQIDYKRFDFVPFAAAIAEEYNGYKLLYHQVPPEARFWKYVIEEIRPKIIFTRRNLLDACLSLRLSRRSLVWQRYHPDQVIEDRPIFVQEWGPEIFYNRFCVREHMYRSLFSSLESMTISYERLIPDWDLVIEEIEEFLGIQRVKLEKAIFKRTMGTPAEMFLDYREFLAKLENMKVGDYARTRSCWFL